MQNFETSGNNGVKPSSRFLQRNGDKKGSEDEAVSSNFDFWTYTEEDFNKTAYANQSALPVSAHGIKKVQIALNLKSFQDQYDTDMMSIFEALNKVGSLADFENEEFREYYLGTSQFDESFIEEIRNYIEKEPFSDVSRFQTWKWNTTSKDEREGAFMSDGAPLGDINFEVEVKELNG